MEQTEFLTARIPGELKYNLQRLAVASGRSASSVLRDLLQGPAKVAVEILNRSAEAEEREHEHK